MKRRELRTVAGPKTGYDVIAMEKPRQTQTMIPQRRKVNNSDNMKTSLAQPFVTIDGARKALDDPKEITRALFPQSARNSSTPLEPTLVHHKGNISKIGGACFYLY